MVGEIEVEMRERLDHPGQIGDCPADDEAVAHQQRIDDEALRIYIVSGDEMSNAHKCSE